MMDSNDDYGNLNNSAVKDESGNDMDICLQESTPYDLSQRKVQNNLVGQSPMTSEDEKFLNQYSYPSSNCKSSVDSFIKLSNDNKFTSGLDRENAQIERKFEEANTLSSSNEVVEEAKQVSVIEIESHSSKEAEVSHKPIIKKVVHLPDGYTDSSQSSSSELQPSALPFESFPSSHGSISKMPRIDFENAIPPTPTWRDSDENSVIEIPVIPKHSEPLSQLELPTTPNIPVVTIDDNTEPAISEAAPTLPSFSSELNATAGVGSDSQVSISVPKVGDIGGKSSVSISTENKQEGSNTAIPVPVTMAEPVPVPIAPTPRKRGRPRKQVLPNPSPLVESWGPNAQQFTPADTPQADGKRSTRSVRRTRKKKLEGVENEKAHVEGTTPKRRYTPKTPNQKKKIKKPKPAYVPKKRGPKPKKLHAELENIQNFEEETRMSASEGQGGFSARSGAICDESQSSFITEGQTKSNINKKGRMEVMTDGCKPITVQQIVEYHWPPPSTLSHGEKPEGLMIQEQITEYLGVKSFKRKYPSIKRRQVDMEERNYLQENGFVSEKMCDLGLTAVFAADIIEIMYNDFPQKFDEYRKYTREKKAKEQRALREKQAAERADMDPLREAVESAQSWNAEFNKVRREKRGSCFDLQTFTVHFPANYYKVISYGKPGNYPIALIPGQNTDYYKKYTSNELKYFPLNTVLYGPLKPNERHFALPSGSDGSQSEIDDDSSSSDESSSSSSEETQDTEETNSTAEEDFVPDVKVEKEVEEKEVKPARVTITKTPRGRGRGRVSAVATAAVATPSTPAINAAPTEEKPKKRLGRPPKIKVAAIKLNRIDNEETSDAVKGEKPDTASRVIIHTCKMCHEEESKNKNGEFESFIECAQCKGKIHPSCIDLTADMIPKISSYGWQCTDCKSCVKCEQSTNEDKMIFCDQCDRGYHIYCVGLSEVPSGNYICHVCKPAHSDGSKVWEKPEESETVKSEQPESFIGPLKDEPEVKVEKEETSEVKTEVKIEGEDEPMDAGKIGP